MDDNPRPSKRARKSCERCRTRKQKCTGYPVCANCASANENCIQPPSAIEEYQSGPNQQLLERITFLEAQLAAYGNSPPPRTSNAQDKPRHVASQGTQEGTASLAEIVGFLSLGGEAVYVGPSSGYSMAANLGQMVQATVWNKAMASTVSQNQPKPVSIADLKRHSAGPPNEDMGGRILDAYLTRVHLRYPFMDRAEILERHANRYTQDNTSPQDQYGTFKIYMIYAIGATMLKLTERYDYTLPETFFMTALKYISAARESHSIHNVEAMTLLVLYNLRSPSNTGIWYMVGLAMRTCVDLGLHREAHYGIVAPYEGQLRRRLFWTVYFLERVIAVSLGRPYSIADRDIDASLPLEIDDTVRSNTLISRTLALSPSPSLTLPSSNTTLFIRTIQLKRLESHIQEMIYRVDRPIASLVNEISPILKKLEDWHRALPPATPYEIDYVNMHYYKAIRLLLQPFLRVLEPGDGRLALCLQASGQICQIFKRLHQRDSYGHSFIALHSVFIAGVTMCYCLFLSPTLWTFTVSNDLRACSSALFVMAERTPVVKKYRDALETIIGSTMEFLARDPGDPNHEPAFTSHPAAVRTPSMKSPPKFAESYVRGAGDGGGDSVVDGADFSLGMNGGVADSGDVNGYGYMPPVRSPEGGGPGRWEGRHGEMGQMDAEWMLSLCEGDGFSLSMLNEMMRFEPSLGV